MDQRNNANSSPDVAVHKIHVTFFKNKFASTFTARDMTLPELRELIVTTKGATKHALPWLKGARFGNKPKPKDGGTPGTCLRWDDNVTGFDSIELDYDMEVMGFDEAVVTIKAMNVRALIYTSPSHTKAGPRLRLLMPVSSSILPLEMRAKLCARVNGRFGGIFSSESFALSQSYYFGLAIDNSSPDHRAEVIDGRMIDLCDDLCRFEKVGWSNSTAGPHNDADNPGARTVNIDWTAVERHAGWLKSITDLPANFSAKGKAIVAHKGNLQDLVFDLAHAGLVIKPYRSWSEVSLALAAILKGNGHFSNEKIAAALMCNLECNRHIVQMKDDDIKRRAVERLIARSYEGATRQRATCATGMPQWREQRANGSPLPSMHNARLAITALGIECSYDTFHNKLLFGYKDDKTRHVVEAILGEATDNGIIALRQLMSVSFGFDLTDKHARDAVKSIALEHCLDPVFDELAEAEANWDGKKRLDLMAADYLNCENTALNSACIRKTMIAAVARVRKPGCKFDTITVLESEEGYNKSSTWRVLAGDPNFSDEKILGKDSREVQEQLEGVWIHENADLAGMKKADVDVIKTFASRTVDRARPAFGHFLKEQRRHSIEVGTTNNSEYLQSQTGNRRFWPMVVRKSIDLDLVRRDRLQLWGEAAHYESAGESVVLDESLWADAGIQQENRRVKDPWEDALAEIPVVVSEEYYKDGYNREREQKIIYHVDDQERVASSDLLTYILDTPVSRQVTNLSMRLSTVMKRLGWERTTNGKVTIEGKQVRGYFRWQAHLRK